MKRLLRSLSAYTHVQRAQSGLSRGNPKGQLQTGNSTVNTMHNYGKWSSSTGLLLGSIGLLSQALYLPGSLIFAFSLVRVAGQSACVSANSKRSYRRCALAPSRSHGQRFHGSVVILDDQRKHIRVVWTRLTRTHWS